MSAVKDKPSDSSELSQVLSQPQHSQSSVVHMSQENPQGALGKTFKCEKCNVHTPLLAAMVTHLRKIHKDIARLFKCPYCDHMEAESETKVQSHIQQCHPTDNPNPPIALTESAKKHRKFLLVKLPGEVSAIERDIYMCLKCKVHMSTLEMINEHLEEEHKEVFVFTCPVCKQFMSHAEHLVLNHLRSVHWLMSESIRISPAIDSRRFTRVQYLISDESESSHDQQQHSPAGKTLPPPTNPFSHQNLPSNLYGTGQQSQPLNTDNTGLFQNRFIVATANSTVRVSSSYSSTFRVPKPVLSTSTQSGIRPASHPKNFLEAIEQMETQKKLEMQKPGQSTMFSAPRPIQSSLIDTSDPYALKPINRKKTVLGIPRPGNRFSPKGQTCRPYPILSRTDSYACAPLDLSVPCKNQIPKENPGIPEGSNPGMFNLFNLQPSAATVRSSLVSFPANVVPQMPAQVDISQQFPPNTSNTLAYRPSIQQVASSLIPQTTSMPMGVIDNMQVSLNSFPQPLQAVQAGIQGTPTLQAVPATIHPNMHAIQTGIQTAPDVQGVPQCIGMNAPVPHAASSATGLYSTTWESVMKLLTFKCPYCPIVIPMKLAEVHPHIEKWHPGSSIVFRPLFSSK